MTRNDIGRYNFRALNITINRCWATAFFDSVFTTVAQKVYIALIVAVTFSVTCYAQNNSSNAAVNQPILESAANRINSASSSPTLNILPAGWVIEITEPTLLSYSSVSYFRTGFEAGSQQVNWANPDSSIALNSHLLTEDDIHRTLQNINREAINSLNQSQWIHPLQYRSPNIHYSGSKKIRSGTSALGYMLRKSLRHWWKSRDTFSLSSTNSRSTDLLANANNFSHNKSNSWDYGVRMSGSKVKLTIKREL